MSVFHRYTLSPLERKTSGFVMVIPFDASGESWTVGAVVSGLSHAAAPVSKESAITNFAGRSLIFEKIRRFDVGDS